eukprot:jgi/Astpho2/9776/Aster-03752
MHPDLGPSADLSKVLSLDNIRQTLIRQEDTIIFSLIERAQFAKNAAVYEPDAIPVPGFDASGQRYSLLEYLLRETEQVHGKIRRFTSPDEQAFFPNDVPPLVLPPIQYAQVLAPGSKAINVNERIMDLYLQRLLPGITEPGDDNNYGSSAMGDVLCLQALSKRIHYGKFVAEAKFSRRAQGADYMELIRKQDRDGLMALLTDRAVERKVVDRVRRKAAMYGQDEVNDDHFNPFSSNGAESPSYKVEPETVAQLYEQFVMPLTKEVQLTYLLHRLDHEMRPQLQ